MNTFIAELGAVISSEAPSTVVCAMFTSLHHKVRRNYEFHIRVSLHVFFWHTNLPQQVVLVCEDCLPRHAMEALRKAESKIWSRYRLEIGLAREAMA